MERRRCCWAVALVLAALVAQEVCEIPGLEERLQKLDLREEFQWFHNLVFELQAVRPLVLEPAGFDPRLKAAIPRSRLTQEELRTYELDGVVLVRGLVRDQALLRQMQRGLATHQQFHGADYTRCWEYNGVARAFMRQEGLLQDLFGPLLSKEDVPLNLMEAPIWGQPGRDPQFLTSSWHYDQALGYGSTPMVTMWMPVTKAPHTIEFVRGSHREHAEITMACNRTSEIGDPAGARTYNDHCVARYGEKLSKQLGHESLYWEDLEPGDAFIFHGALSHRGVQWPKSRTALSMRLGLFYGDELPPCGDPNIVFNRSGRNPMHCVRDRALPRPLRQWPRLSDQLPQGTPGWPSSWVAWLLRVAVAAAGQTFVGES